MTTTKQTSGWVKVRRGLIDHLADGRMTPNEYLLFMMLLMMADSSTGKGTINAPVLQACYLHDWSTRSLQRALAGLEEKHYIWRLNPSGHRRAYPFWVNKYECTDGVHKLSRTDLSQVFVSNDIKDIRYVPSVGVSDDVSDGVTVGVTVGVSDDSYKNKELRTLERRTKKKASPLSIHSVSHCVSQSVSVETEDREQMESQCVSEQVSQSVSPLSVPISVPTKTFMKFEYGADPGWVDKRTGKKLDYESVEQHIGKMGLELRGSDIYENGVKVPFKQAVARIEGEAA